MDIKELASLLSMTTGKSEKDVAHRIDTAARILRNFCKPIKENEIIVKDADGKRTLMPPSIEVNFKSSVILRKALGK